MARPTSRWAIASRVTESIIRSTSAPESRKCSATVVATSAALMRTSAGWSEVATTTTERARASPRSRSMNSSSSRPRSPTRQITFTEAVVARAMEPSRVDLPTPEPAKMPRRWPRPQGTSASRARTPSSSRSLMRGRSIGDGGEPATTRGRQPVISAPPSIGRPSPSSTRPSRASPTATRNGPPVGATTVPGAMPRMSPSGMSRARPLRKPTTSAGTAARLRPPAMVTSSPTSARRPVASMTRPIRFVTRPRWLCRSASAIAREYAARGRSAVGSGTVGLRVVRRRAARLGQQPADALELRAHARVDLAGLGAHDAPARLDAPLRDDLHPADAAEPGGELRRRVAHELEVARVHLQHEVVAVGGAQERAGDDAEHRLAVGGDRRADHLLGDLEGQVDGGRLGLRDVAVVHLGHRPFGGGHGLEGLLDAHARLGHAALEPLLVAQMLGLG